MGLAASQGRFLLLTARQSDVEMRMQSLTNQKLALARESMALSARHTRALNAQNVMWQPANAETATELNYNSLMYENSPYVLTNAYGAVMLDGASSFSKQLCSALDINPADYPNGITGDQFKALAGSKEKFLRNFVTGSIGATGDSASGSIDDKIKALIDDEAIFGNTDNKGTSVFETYYDSNKVKSMAFYENGGDANKEQLVSQTITGSKTEQGSCILGGILNAPGKILSGNFGGIVDDFTGSTTETNYKSEGEARDYLNSAAQVANTMGKASQNIKAITNNLSSALQITLCGGEAPDGTVYSGDLKDFSAQIKAACAWAEQATLNKFLQDVNDQNSLDQESGVGENSTHGKVSDDKSKASNSNDLDFVYNSTSTSTGLGILKAKTTTSSYEAFININQDQVADTFLSYFDLYCEQHFSPNTTTVNGQTVSTGNNVNTTAASLGSTGNVVTNDTTYRGYTYTNAQGVTKPVGGTSGKDYCTINGVAVGQSASVDQTGAYWLKIYNQIADKGLQFNSQLSNKDYVQQQMIYGNVVLNELKGYSSTATVSINDENSPMYVEADEEAIEAENRRYEQEKDALDYKETLMDTMLEDLDAEREAINTEKDSVKKIIDNNIKKFKIFDA